VQLTSQRDRLTQTRWVRHAKDKGETPKVLSPLGAKAAAL